MTPLTQIVLIVPLALLLGFASNVPMAFSAISFDCGRRALGIGLLVLAVVMVIGGGFLLAWASHIYFGWPA